MHFPIIVYRMLNYIGTAAARPSRRPFMTCDLIDLVVERKPRFILGKVTVIINLFAICPLTTPEQARVPENV